MDKYQKNISQEQQEEFEKVLLNQMNSKELASFHNKLNGNPELKHQFETFKELFLAVEEEGLRNSLNTFHNNLMEKHDMTEVKKNKFYWYQIAAGIAMLISLSIWFFNKPSANEKLFETYYNPDPGLPTVMGSSDNYRFYEAMVDYKQGNYHVAIKKWEEQLLAKPGNDTLSYFLGSAHLANGNNKKALAYFNKTLNSKESVFSRDAHYYLALGQLQNDNAKEAIKNLNRASTERSKVLLKKIKE